MRKNSASSKPSFGLACVAWLMIALAVFQLQQSCDYKGLVEVYSRLYTPSWGIFYYVLTVCFSIIEIILGFGVLSLHEWARRGILAMVVVYILTTFMMSLTINRNYFGYIQGTFTEFELLLNKLNWRFENKIRRLNAMREKAATEEARRSIDELSRKEKNLLRAHFWSKLFLGLNIGVLIVKFFLWYIFAVIYFIRPDVRKQFKC